MLVPDHSNAGGGRVEAATQFLGHQTFIAVGPLEKCIFEALFSSNSVDNIFVALSAWSSNLSPGLPQGQIEINHHLNRKGTLASLSVHLAHRHPLHLEIRPTLNVSHSSASLVQTISSTQCRCPASASPGKSATRITLFFAVPIHSAMWINHTYHHHFHGQNQGTSDKILSWDEETFTSPSKSSGSSARKKALYFTNPSVSLESNCCFLSGASLRLKTMLLLSTTPALTGLHQ